MTRESSIALRVGVPIVAVGVLLVVAWLARRPDGVAAPPLTPVEDIVCVEPAAPVAPIEQTVPIPPALVAPVEKPMPGPDIWALLEKCFQDTKRQEYLWQGPVNVTVADVRRYVEVEHDPVWLEQGAWWLPLSGEGDPDYPSGLYISVPIDGSMCGGAIVN